MAAPLQVFIAPCSNEISVINLKRTIENSVEYTAIEKYLDEGSKRILSGRNKLNIWGSSLSKETSWERVRPGDYFFFYRNKTIIKVGKVYYKTRNPALADAIWEKELDDQTGKAIASWPFITFLEDIKDTNIPSNVIQKHAGYDTDIIQQFQPMREQGVTSILNQYGSIENFIAPTNRGATAQTLLTTPIKQTPVDIQQILENKRQIVLYGPPGTGKTYITKDIIVRLLIGGS